MTTFICLLRGVNVGGNNRIKMAEFRAFLGSLGFGHVETYVQSGSAVFTSELGDCASVRRQIADAFHPKFGFVPKIMVLTAEDLNQAIFNNPFPEAEAEPAKLHFGFMQETPDSGAIELLKSKPNAGEQWRVIGAVFYLYSPLGMGKSVLAPFIERTLKVPITMRNWNTVVALAGMVGE